MRSKKAALARQIIPVSRLINETRLRFVSYAVTLDVVPTRGIYLMLLQDIWNSTEWEWLAIEINHIQISYHNEAMNHPMRKLDWSA